LHLLAWAEGSHHLREEPAPEPDTEMGGWSGELVLLLGEINYPLVGIISQYQNTFGLLRIATLEGKFLRPSVRVYVGVGPDRKRSGSKGMRFKVCSNDIV
jgi:hypothetical protein